VIFSLVHTRQVNNLFRGRGRCGRCGRCGVSWHRSFAAERSTSRRVPSPSHLSMHGPGHPCYRLPCRHNYAPDCTRCAIAHSHTCV